MKEWVKEKLNIIEELFPSERIERSKGRWERMWKGEKQIDRYPYVNAPLLYDYYDERHTPKQRLSIGLDEIIVHGKTQDDYIPSIFPGCRQSTIPTM